MTAGNKVRIGGTWYHIDDLSDYPLSRVHSVSYKHGHVWQIAFGTTILELTAEQALVFKEWVAGIDDSMMDGHA